MSNIQALLNPVGIFDSGVGGLSVLEALQKRLPHENFLYIADNINAPYGEKSAEWICQRSDEICQFLIERGAKAIVVACNTATAASVAHLREKFSLPVIGLEPAIKPSIEISRTKKIGVLATRRTLQSEKYQLLKSRFITQAEFVEIASSELVEIVESGEAHSTASLEVIRRVVLPFVESHIDVLVLGCTHFPFLEKQLRQIVGEKVVFLDSAAPVAAEVARRINDHLNPSTQPGEVVYYASDPGKLQSHINAVNGRPVHLELF